MHVLCGANEHLHEIVEFSKALKPVKDINPHIAAYPANKDLEQVFKEEISENPITINKSPNLLDFTASGGI